MSGKVLFACSKCFSRHPFEELSSGQQLCKNCRSSTLIVKCAYCRSEFHPISKSQNACKKCEHDLSKYGKPSACECCNIVAAFGGSKCMRCASYEAKYGPPVTCDECKQRSAFDKGDENKKINGKLLCWLCTSAFKRALMKAQAKEASRRSSKKRPHEKSHRDGSSASAKKSSRRSEIAKNSVTAVSAAGLDVPETISRKGSGGSAGSNSGASNVPSIGLGLITAPAVISIDPNSGDHVAAITDLKERIASLEKRLLQKDKELLEKDKQLTELKGKNFEKECEMRNKIKEIERLNEMKVEQLKKKVASLLREVAALQRNCKKNGVGSSTKDKIKDKRESISPKEELASDRNEKQEKDYKRDRGNDDADDKESSDSRSNSPNSN